MLVESRKQFHEQGFMIRVQVLNDHERHAGVRWKVLEDGAEGFQSSGRRTDSHHREIIS